MIAFIIGLILFVTAVALRGFVLTFVWLWFVTPLGVPAIGLWHAFGISLVASWLTMDTTLTRDKRGVVENMLASIFMSLAVWLMAFLFHLGNVYL